MSIKTKRKLSRVSRILRRLLDKSQGFFSQDTILLFPSITSSGLAGVSLASWCWQFQRGVMFPEELSVRHDDFSNGSQINSTGVIVLKDRSKHLLVNGSLYT